MHVPVSPILQSCCFIGSHTFCLWFQSLQSDGQPPEGAANSDSILCLPRLLELGALDQAVGQPSGKARRAGLLLSRPCPLSHNYHLLCYHRCQPHSHIADLVFLWALWEEMGALCSQAFECTCRHSLVMWPLETP